MGIPCTAIVYECPVPVALTVLYTVLIASLSGYFLGSAFYIRRAFCSLRTKSYSQNRMDNQFVRVQVWIGSVTCWC